MGIARSWGMRNGDTEFGVIEKFYRWMMAMVAQQHILNATEWCI